MATDITIEKLKDFNLFFFYGKSDLDLETASEVTGGIIQPKRSMFYYRQEGCGVADKENNPKSVALNVAVRYEIVSWVGFRNTQVTDGSNGTKDRRIATSQTQIGFRPSNDGELNVDMKYIPLANFNRPKDISFPIAWGV